MASELFGVMYGLTVRYTWVWQLKKPIHLYIESGYLHDCKASGTLKYHKPYFHHHALILIDQHESLFVECNTSSHRQNACPSVIEC